MSPDSIAEGGAIHRLTLGQLRFLLGGGKPSPPDKRDHRRELRKMFRLTLRLFGWSTDRLKATPPDELRRALASAGWKRPEPLVRLLRREYLTLACCHHHEPDQKRH